MTEYTSGNRKKAYAAAVLFSFVVGFTFLAAKLLMGTVTPIEALAYRFNAALITALFVSMFNRDKICFRGRITSQLLLMSLLYCLFMLFQFAGLKYCTSIESGIIFALIPIIVQVLAAFFLKERSTAIQNLFVFISVASIVAMIVLGAGDLTLNLKGITLLLISSLCMAVSNIFMRKLRGEYNPYEISIFISFTGFVMFNIIFVSVLLYNDENPLRYFAHAFNLQFILSITYLGSACVVLSVFLMSYMLRHLEALKASLFGNLSTAISIVAGVLLLSEPLLSYHIICTILIVIGVIGVSAAGKSAADK